MHDLSVLVDQVGRCRFDRIEEHVTRRCRFGLLKQAALRVEATKGQEALEFSVFVIRCSGFLRRGNLRRGRFLTLRCSSRRALVFRRRRSLACGYRDEQRQPYGPYSDFRHSSPPFFLSPAVICPPAAQKSRQIFLTGHPRAK
jgi:hypothetical protein